MPQEVENVQIATRPKPRRLRDSARSRLRRLEGGVIWGREARSRERERAGARVTGEESDAMSENGAAEAAGSKKSFFTGSERDRGVRGDTYVLAALAGVAKSRETPIIVTAGAALGEFLKTFDVAPSRAEGSPRRSQLLGETK